MPEEESNGSWRNTFIGLLISLVLGAYAFTFIAVDSKESKEDVKNYKEQHKLQHDQEVAGLRQNQQDIKETVKETKEDIKEIKKMILEQGREQKNRSIR